MGVGISLGEVKNDLRERFDAYVEGNGGVVGVSIAEVDEVNPFAQSLKAIEVEKNE